jgi:hypothetical protein
MLNILPPLKTVLFDTNRRKLKARYQPRGCILTSLPHFSTIIGRLKLKGVRGFHLLGEPQPPEGHAEQNGPHFAIGLDLSQLEASPRFFSEIQHVSSNLQYVVHRTHPSLRGALARLDTFTAGKIVGISWRLWAIA